MSRLMSVAMTTDAVIARRKTVTRRVGWWENKHGRRILKPGDTLRTLGGVSRVTAVEPLEAQPVFNLEVAGQNTFFAGEQGVLVHDNNLVHSTPEPFDAAPDLAAVVPSPSPR